MSNNPGPSNSLTQNWQSLVGTPITFAQQANPSTSLLASPATIYQTPDGNFWKSNGVLLTTCSGVDPLPFTAPNFGQNMIGGYSVWNGNPSSSTNGTLQLQWQSPVPFNGVRLVYTNPTTSDITMSKARVAVTTTKGGNGGNLTWVAVTFNGSTSVNLPNCVSAVAGQEQYTQVISDPVQISNADSQCILYTRSDYAGNFAAIDPGLGNVISWNNNVNTVAGLGAAGNAPDGNPIQWQNGLSAGVVANDTVGISMNTAVRDMSPDSVIFNATVPTITVGACGGSHLAGNTTFGNNMGFLYRACLQKTAASGGTRMWAPFNFARGGAGSAPSLKNIQLMDTAGYFPQILFILVSSGDDGNPTVARLQASRYRMSEALKILAKNRCRPILCTAPPVGSYSFGFAGSEDDLRKQENIWARSQRQYGFEVLDLEQFYVDPNDPFQHQMNPAISPGGIHANDAGQVPVATYVQNNLL